MGYNKEIREYIKVKIESSPNNAAIARDVINKFNLDKSDDTVRMLVSSTRRTTKNDARKKPIKRLFFDIETGYYILKIKAWQMKNYNTYFDCNDIVSDKKIICISYKWQYEDKVHTLSWNKKQDEKAMLKSFIKVMAEADELVGHNIDSFDLKVLRTRCMANGVLMYPTYRTLDTLKKSRQYFSNASNKLDYLAKWLDVGGKLSHEGMKMWKAVVEDNDQKALSKMISYCEHDVVINEDVYYIMAPYIYHNTNFAVLKGGDKWDCPECASQKVEMYKTYTTALGIVRRNMRCHACKKQYRVSNATYLRMLQSTAANDRLKKAV